jgi:hypothetical protein
MNIEADQMSFTINLQFVLGLICQFLSSIMHDIY